MITGEIKKKVDKIWEIFWTGGLTNPLTVIEQFTYLLFMKRLDEIERKKEKEATTLGVKYEGIFTEENQHLRWSRFKTLQCADEMFQVVSNEVFPFIKTLHHKEESAYSKYMNDALFLIPTANMLSKIVEEIDQLPVTKNDTKGDLYEYLLSKIATSGKNGQFRTPRHIINMIVELMKPTVEDIIIDPAMGTCGFLVAASEYIQKHEKDKLLNEKVKDHFHNTMFYGYDTDRTMLRIGAMNMMLHGVENPNITYQNSLSKENGDKEKFTLILANPPFKGTLDYDAVSDDLLQMTKTKKAELLFLSLFLRILKVGGRAAVIVSDGVLFRSSKAYKQIRKEMIENHKVEAIISMPSGIFKPYAGVSTAIIIFTKTGVGGTKKVWFYDMEADGFSLDDKRSPMEHNDIPDIINRFHNLQEEQERKRTDQSFLVPIEEIRENEYDLSINKYKEWTYEEIEYEDPLVILKRINELEKEIVTDLEELEALLK